MLKTYKDSEGVEHVDFEGYNIPQHTKDALERYFLHGLKPGSFLTLCLRGDIRAILQADGANTVCFKDIVSFLYNCAPMTSWGSKEEVELYVGEIREWNKNHQPSS